MLDGESFLRAGWVQGLKLHSYTGTRQKRFLIKGKVSYIMDPQLYLSCSPYVSLIIYIGYAFTKDICHTTDTMGCDRRGWRSISSSLQLHGRVCICLQLI